MKSMYNPSDEISYGFMYDLVCNEHKYSPFYGHNVLDLGAHHGFFSLFCAARGANVVAYEPDRENFEKLENASALARDNDEFGKIEIHNCGVWSSNTHLVLYRDHHSGTSNIVGKGSTQQSDVSVVSFHEALNGQKWDCVKIDIEGAEFEIFDKVSDEDLRLIRFLTLELHPHLILNPQPRYEKLMSRLESHFDVRKFELNSGRYCKLFCTELNV